MKDITRRVLVRQVTSSAREVPFTSSGKRLMEAAGDDVLEDRYEDVVEALLTDGEVVTDFIEGLITEDHLQVRDGSVYYGEKKIL